MSFEWNSLHAIVLLSWLFTASFVGIPTILFSGLILFSGSTSINLLLLITLTLLSFLASSKNSKRKFASLSQKYHIIRFSGLLLALLGSLMYPPLLMVGLILSMPNFLWAIFFDRHYLSMTTRSYLYSTVVPALLTLVVLGRVKGLVKVDYTQLWDVTVTVVGLGTLITGSMLAFLKRNTKALVVSLSQASIGLGVFLLLVDAESYSVFAMSALLCFAVASPILLIVGKQLSVRAETVSRVILLGMPGFLGFSTLYYSLKSIAALNVHWIWFVLVAYFFQMLAMIVNSSQTELPRAPVDRRARLRFGLCVSVQLLCSMALYWFEQTGVK
jgi:hypothetical protein